MPSHTGRRRRATSASRRRRAAHADVRSTASSAAPVDDGRVAVEALDLVEAADLVEEHVDDDVAVVEQHPLLLAQALDAPRRATRRGRARPARSRRRASARAAGWGRPCTTNSSAMARMSPTSRTTMLRACFSSAARAASDATSGVGVADRVVVSPPWSPSGRRFVGPGAPSATSPVEPVVVGRPPRRSEVEEVGAEADDGVDTGDAVLGDADLDVSEQPVGALRVAGQRLVADLDLRRSPRRRRPSSCHRQHVAADEQERRRRRRRRPRSFVSPPPRAARR